MLMRVGDEQTDEANNKEVITVLASLLSYIYTFFIYRSYRIFYFSIIYPSLVFLSYKASGILVSRICSYNKKNIILSYSIYACFFFFSFLCRLFFFVLFPFFVFFSSFLVQNCIAKFESLESATNKEVITVSASLLSTIRVFSRNLFFYFWYRFPFFLLAQNVSWAYKE